MAVLQGSLQRAARSPEVLIAGRHLLQQVGDVVRSARHVAVSGVEAGEVSGARCTLLKPRARVVAAAAAARKGGGGAHKPVSGIRLSVYVSAPGCPRPAPAARRLPDVLQVCELQDSGA